MVEYSNNYQILKQINELPVNEVKSKIDSMTMTFSQWTAFTNEHITFAENLDSKQKNIFNNSNPVSYIGYLEVLNACYREPIGKAKMARANRDAFLEEKGKNEDEKSFQILTEEEVIILEKTEQIWNQVKEKYDPKKEIGDVCRDTQDCLKFGLSVFEIESNIDEIESNIVSFKRSAEHLSCLKVKNSKVQKTEAKILEAMENGLEKLKMIAECKEQPIEEFIASLEVSKKDVNKIILEMKKNGTEKIDIGTLRELIVSDCIDFKDIIEGLEEIEIYESMIEKLPDNKVKKKKEQTSEIPNNIDEIENIEIPENELLVDVEEINSAELVLEDNEEIFDEDILANSDYDDELAAFEAYKKEISEKESAIIEEEQEEVEDNKDEVYDTQNEIEEEQEEIEEEIYDEQDEIEDNQKEIDEEEIDEEQDDIEDSQQERDEEEFDRIEIIKNASVEEYKEAIELLDEEINENTKNIKKSLILKILEKQKIIKLQQDKISELEDRDRIA